MILRLVYNCVFQFWTYHGQSVMAGRVLFPQHVTRVWLPVTHLIHPFCVVAWVSTTVETVERNQG